MATTVTPTSGDGVFDNTLMFISSGNLTKGAVASLKPSSGHKIRGTPVKGLAARILIPAWPGTTMKLLPQIYVSADNSTYRVQAQYEGGYLSKTKSSSGAEQEIMVPFESISGYPYVKLGFAIVGGTTGSSFGAVRAGIVPRAHGDWTRAVRFD